MIITITIQTVRELKKKTGGKSSYYLLLAIVLLFLSAGGYFNVLNSFFVGDDFFLLRLAKSGISPFAKADFAFYRPLVLSFWFSEYQLWHLTPVFYHISNLLLLVITSLLVAANVNALAGSRAYGWLAAILFCVYPGHPEAVSWLAGRFDVLTTIGALLSLLCLIKFCRLPKVPNKKKEGAVQYTLSSIGWLVAALFFYFGALLSKEAALFMPLIAMPYVFLEDIFSHKSIATSLKSTAIVTFLFILVTSIYLVLRFAILGGFDNYDNANYNFFTFLIPTIKAYFALITPVNQVLLNNYGLLNLTFIIGCWSIVIVSICFLVIWLIKVKQGRFTILILLGFLWSVLAIEPALTVNYIREGLGTPDLEGSRVLYCSSFGLCLLLAIALIELFKAFPKAQMLKPFFILAITSFYLILLVLNNITWSRAGEQARQIEQSFEEVVTLARTTGHDLTKPDPGVGILIQGLPDNYYGAYSGHNMFEYQDNLGTVFYNLNTPVAELGVDQPLPDFSKLNFRTLYLVRYSVVGTKITLQTIQKLDKDTPMQTLFGVENLP